MLYWDVVMGLDYGEDNGGRYGVGVVCDVVWCVPFWGVV